MGITENRPLPLYAKLKESIIDDVEKGILKPGNQISSQHELREKYSMSHMTIRRAINELITEGVLLSIQGKGIYVAEKTRTGDMSSLVGYEKQMAHVGLVPSTRLLLAEIISASTVLARVLDVDVASSLVHIRRLRLADGEPLSLSDSYLPSALCPGILKYDFNVASLFSTLREVYHLRLARGVSTIESILANQEQAELFNISLPAAFLLREQITYLDTGQAIEYSRTFIRGEKFHVLLEESESQPTTRSYITRG